MHYLFINYTKVSKHMLKINFNNLKQINTRNYYILNKFEKKNIFKLFKIRNFSKKESEFEKIYNNFNVKKPQELKSGKIATTLKVVVVMGFIWLIYTDIPYFYRPTKFIFDIILIYIYIEQCLLYLKYLMFICLIII